MYKVISTFTITNSKTRSHPIATHKNTSTDDPVSYQRRLLRTSRGYTRYDPKTRWKTAPQIFAQVVFDENITASFLANTTKPSHVSRNTPTPPCTTHISKKCFFLAAWRRLQHRRSRRAKIVTGLPCDKRLPTIKLKTQSFHTPISTKSNSADSFPDAAWCRAHHTPTSTSTILIDYYGNQVTSNPLGG